MFKYNSDHKDNTWKTLLQNIVDDSTLQVATTQFCNQLKIDSENYENKQPVSECGYFAPRVRSSLDKKFNVARNIAITLFPPDLSKKDQEAQKIWSYMRYQKLIAKLSNAFVEQIEHAEAMKSEFREVRQTGQRKYFCELKNKPLSSHILEPKAMPVNVSPIEELQPFFDHLSSNSTIEVEQMEFQRGVQYNDGRMDLCKQVVGPPHISQLMKSLQNNTHIDHFLLGNNIIGLNGAKAISEFLLGPHVPQIKTWYLAGNDIDAKGAKLLCDALKKDTVCEAFWLKRNPLGSDGAKYIAELLEVNNTIKILDLDNTGILDEGVKHIMYALEKNTGLKQLYLDANGITPVGTQYVADYFNYLVKTGRKGVTSLWLGINRLDDEGATILAKSLKNYKFLKRLVVNSNRLTEVGTQALCDALVDHTNLISFDLGIYKSTSDLNELPNNIGDKGAVIMADFIRKNKSVQVLSVLHNDISEDGVKLLADALLENDTIVWLYYEQYGVGIAQPCRLAIRSKLEKNIHKHFGLDVGDFCNNKLRYIKGSKKLKNIDSVYRNRM